VFEGATSANYVDLTRDGEPGWFCMFCRTIHPKRGVDLRECPTPGCRRPTGFGRYGDTPRPPR